MDFYYFHTLFLSLTNYLKKKLLWIVTILGLLVILFLYFYIQYSFKLESSSDFLKLLNGSSSDFLNSKQTGIYEDIRMAIIEKDLEEKKFLQKFKKFDDFFSKYLKFINQINGRFEEDSFDSILEAPSSHWSQLLIASKVCYDKAYNQTSIEKNGLPFFLNAFIQCKKGGTK